MGQARPRSPLSRVLFFTKKTKISESLRNPPAPPCAHELDGVSTVDSRPPPNCSPFLFHRTCEPVGLEEKKEPRKSGPELRLPDPTHHPPQRKKINYFATTTTTPLRSTTSPCITTLKAPRRKKNQRNRSCCVGGCAPRRSSPRSPPSAARHRPAGHPWCRSRTPTPCGGDGTAVDVFWNLARRVAERHGASSL